MHAVRVLPSHSAFEQGSLVVPAGHAVRLP
jgi:hypothetical protein